MKLTGRTLLAFAFSCVFAHAAHAAPPKYRWGGLTSDHMPGVSFRRQANNISSFKAYVPILCHHSDSTESVVIYSISGDEVPDLLITRGRSNHEFHDDDGSLGLSAEVSVDIHFQSSTRARADIIVVTDPDPETSCSGSISYERIHRGLRVR